MSSNSEIRFYVDTMIVETLLSDGDIYKKADAGTMSQLTESIKNYVGNHIDPDDRTGSVLNMLAPGAISVLFKAMGFGKIGLLFGLAVSVFHIDVKSILSSIYDGVKSLLSSGKQVTSSQVDGLVNSAIQSHGGADSDESQIQTASVQEQLKDAKILKLALMSYDKDIVSLEKTAAFTVLASRKGKTLGILGRVLSWVFKIALSAAGFMVAGDAVNKLLGKPNAFDGTVRDGKPIEEPAIESTPISKQSKFPLKPGFVDTRYNFGNNNWIEKINNSKSSIENMILGFTKEVYDGLDGQDSAIRNSSAFQNTVEEVVWYNHSAAGDPIVFIPKKFVSKKQLVDSFIDQVAGTAYAPAQQTVSPKLPSGSYLV
jgi:hypothetical protein